MTNIIAASRHGYENLGDKLSEITHEKFILINKKEDLTFKNLQRLHPKYIFLPHWSHIIPEEVYKNFECIIFHMTDVPFGRGGSPLQNLVARGIYETKISALKCEAEIDAGPVYLKKDFSLYGTAEEIYMRTAQVIEEMIIWIIKNEPTPEIQQGEIVCFKRRKEEESNITEIDNLISLYDHIRMLDAEGYPRAFLETEYFRLEFQRASLKKDCLHADVIIKRKEYHE